MVDPVAARDASLRFVTGENAVLADDDDDDAIEEHPFFDGLKAAPKEDEWDAETILTTYTTTENHPTTIKMARRPRRGDETIQLDRRTGLPVGTVLPATEERLRREAELVGGGDEEDYGDDMSEFGRHEGLNLGVARPKNEAAEDKRERKAAAKAAKAARRMEKKGTKEAFRTERNEQLKIRRDTVQVPMQSLSRFPGQS